jgi:hypothetical protein
MCQDSATSREQAVFEDVEEGMFSLEELDKLTRTGDMVTHMIAILRKHA